MRLERVFRVLPLLLVLAACGGGGGGNNNGGGGGGGTISFAVDIQPIFNTDCVICHGGAGLLELDTYAHVIAGGTSGPVVVAGDPDNSLIVKRIEGTIMPQMPLGGVPLTAAEIGRIRQWILEGALDN